MSSRHSRQLPGSSRTPPQPHNSETWTIDDIIHLYKQLEPAIRQIRKLRNEATGINCTCSQCPNTASPVAHWHTRLDSCCQCGQPEQIPFFDELGDIESFLGEIESIQDAAIGEPGWSVPPHEPPPTPEAIRPPPEPPVETNLAPAPQAAAPPLLMSLEPGHRLAERHSIPSLWRSTRGGTESPEMLHGYITRSPSPADPDSPMELESPREGPDSLEVSMLMEVLDGEEDAEGSGIAPVPPSSPVDSSAMEDVAGAGWG
ncbi:hypothetical protein BJ508DRAFT_309518 [Ascobolus immersus RN42]|uniref:Uncharacterized protein n=1 Tax=Ascobolus immersus RN42 TaxID=1160509 RepID=A0A3N4I8P7_ASCIM|nr:hypothetical protein BJ508DRAFT_309518 [Ascobolus immersus RN42]